MNLQTPPQTDDIEDLRRWCNDLYEFLKFPAFQGFRLVPRSSMADTSEGNVYYDSDTHTVNYRNAAAWRKLGVYTSWDDLVGDYATWDDLMVDYAAWDEFLY